MRNDMRRRVGVKVKLRSHEETCGSEGKAPLILKLNTRLRIAVNFSSTSITPGQDSPGTCWPRSSVGNSQSGCGGEEKWPSANPSPPTLLDEMLSTVLFRTERSPLPCMENGVCPFRPHCPVALNRDQRPARTFRTFCVATFPRARDRTQLLRCCSTVCADACRTGTPVTDILRG
jgi:hypothetical protein